MEQKTGLSKFQATSSWTSAGLLNGRNSPRVTASGTGWRRRPCGWDGAAGEGIGNTAGRRRCLHAGHRSGARRADVSVPKPDPLVALPSCALRRSRQDRLQQCRKSESFSVVAPCVRAAIQTAHLAGNVRRLFKEALRSALRSALVEAGTPHRPDRALSA